MRLWLLEQVGEIEAALVSLIRVMVERADKERDHLMPGYTHLQVSFRSTPFLRKGEYLIDNTPLHSAGNPFVGLTYSCLMPFLSAPISSAFASSSRGYQFFLLARAHLRVTPSPLIATSSQRNSNSSLLQKTVYGVWVTATL
jgi:hypothetical protein